MSQQYSLRWNNHQPNFISMFTSLLNTQTLVDVTLAAEGKQLKAHKVVLSACSTYFQSLFVDNPSRHPIVILKDVTFADLRTMVDFMYCGEVNVTEEQLPKVLDTAKLLKIKGLTEMPESTSLTRSQGTSSDFQSCTSADFQSPRESLESQRHSVSPALSSSNRRKRRRMSSGGSGQLNLMPEENRGDENAGQVEIMRGANDTVTMRSVPQQRDLDTQHQTNDQQNLNVEPLAMDAANNSVISQESTSAPTIRVRRTKLFKRQSRVQPEEREVHKQASEPAPAHAHSAPQLQKHQSYPQYTFGNRRARTQEIEVDPLAIPDMTVVRQASTSSADQLQRASHTPAMREEVEPLAILDMTVVRQAYSSADQLQRACHTPAMCEEVEPLAILDMTVVRQAYSSAYQLQRASHTPAMCEGPPLSCNFCWNTVDESGRILRRKTQYHCPECRTNLCIVPCFHEYHDGTAAEASAR